MRGGWAGAYFKHFFKSRVQQIFQWGNSKNNAFEEAQGIYKKKTNECNLKFKKFHMVLKKWSIFKPKIKFPTYILATSFTNSSHVISFICKQKQNS